MANNTTGFTRIIKAAGYSWKGLRAAWINEAAFRQEGVAVLLASVRMDSISIFNEAFSSSCWSTTMAFSLIFPFLYLLFYFHIH